MGFDLNAELAAVRGQGYELHSRYLKDVYRYVLQRAPSIEEAEDITAEVFAAAARDRG